MAALNIGTGVVWAMPDITSLKTGATQTAATAATARSITITSLSLTKNRQVDETMDADGDVVAAVFYGESTDMTLECFPSASSISSAKTANALPSVGDVLKITPASDTEDADVATASAGYWTITAASKSRSNTTKTTWSLTCKRWGGISDHSQL